MSKSSFKWKEEIPPWKEIWSGGSKSWLSPTDPIPKKILGEKWTSKKVDLDIWSSWSTYEIMTSKYPPQQQQLSPFYDLLASTQAKIEIMLNPTVSTFPPFWVWESPLYKNRPPSAAHHPKKPPFHLRRCRQVIERWELLLLLLLLWLLWGHELEGRPKVKVNSTLFRFSSHYLPPKIFFRVESVEVNQDGAMSHCRIFLEKFSYAQLCLFFTILTPLRKKNLCHYDGTSFFAIVSFRHWYIP